MMTVDGDGQAERDKKIEEERRQELQRKIKEAQRRERQKEEEAKRAEQTARVRQEGRSMVVSDWPLWELSWCLVLWHHARLEYEGARPTLQFDYV